MYRRIVISFLLASALAAGLPGEASAEGNRTTYISRWDDGTESSRWVDNQINDASTSIKFVRCRSTHGATEHSMVDVKLWRDRVLWPDRQFATIRYRSCFRPDPAYSLGLWPAQQGEEAGLYYFSTPLIYSGRLDVGSSGRHGIRVTW